MLGGSIREQTPAGELGKQNAYQPVLPAMQHPVHTPNHKEAVGYEMRSSHDGDGLLARVFFQKRHHRKPRHKVEQLTVLGISEQEARRALRATGRAWCPDPTSA